MVKFDEDNEREDRNLLQSLDKSVLRFRVNAVHRSQVFRPDSLAGALVESLSELLLELLSVAVTSLSAFLPEHLSVPHSEPLL